MLGAGASQLYIDVVVLGPAFTFYCNNSLLCARPSFRSLHSIRFLPFSLKGKKEKKGKKGRRGENGRRDLVIGVPSAKTSVNYHSLHGSAELL